MRLSLARRLTRAARSIQASADPPATAPDAPALRTASTLTGGNLVLDIDGVPHRMFDRALHLGSWFPPAYQVSLYSLAELHARQADLRRTVLGFGALGLLAGLALSIVLARGLSGPVEQLVAATNQVEHGNLDVRVPEQGADELGRLARSFNQMTVGLALKERYRSVLNLLADAEVAQQLVDGSIALGGELREASVLFCDIRDFTALTEHMNPEDVIELLNEHMTALAGVVADHGGVVDKFVGDALIAIFGAPRTTGRDVGNAVAAARGMIAARARLNAGGQRSLSIGIGIASGPVVAGCMGAPDRLSYTVLGQRVNLAARLCAQAGPMEVLIDETTEQQLGHEVAREAIAPLTLKGFSTTVRAFRVADMGRESAAS
jgi:class 3 adenylate cyclase